jgi:magnesium transporter
MIIDRAIYVNGVRSAEPLGPLDEMYEACKALGGMTWIGLLKPTEDEFEQVAAEFGLHPLAVEDAIVAHQRPKIEHYGDTLFVVLSAATYFDATETVEFAELHVFVGADFIITVRHGSSPDLSQVRRRMEEEVSLLQRGPEAVLYAILDRVVDDYTPVVLGLENDIDEIEAEVFGGNGGVSQRTYELAHEAVQFQRAVAPLPNMLQSLITGSMNFEIDDEVKRYLRDVEDHAIQVHEQVVAFRELLQNILSVNLMIIGLKQNEEVKLLTQASIAQNDEVKRISAWAAILFAPTLVGTIYGMNFVHMPELDWRLGYPFALLLMVAVSALVYGIVKRIGWLN